MAAELTEAEAAPSSRSAFARTAAFVGLCLLWTARAVRRLIFGTFALIALLLLSMVAGNVIFHTPRNVSFRALHPDEPACRDREPGGWTVLADFGNNEWAAVDAKGAEWQAKLSCSIQRHALTGYRTPAGDAQPLHYDLAFVEFQEDGKPYPLLDDQQALYLDPTSGGQPMGQLDALLRHLRRFQKNYVIAFAHGWRHTAQLGDGNVADLRVYAAHAARFLADRCAAGDDRYCGMNVTAVFLGWRGARTDEIWLARHLGKVGEWIGTYSAVFTLFDRKPISEAIAPSVLAALRAIENALGMQVPLDVSTGLPVTNPNRFIIFGHSLGGNVLATALKDQLVKDVQLHKPGSYLPPPLGNLVVLLNAASEAANWTAFQRAVWDRVPMAVNEHASLTDFVAGHSFFQKDQRPVLISVTAARDWPPGGLRAIDCVLLQSSEARRRLLESRELSGSVDYDSATYDLFPLFKYDFRPFADTLSRWAASLNGSGSKGGPCSPPAAHRGFRELALAGVAAGLRVLPFMATDLEQTRTIGNLDPPRAPRGTLRQYYASGRPFGTTHELRSNDASAGTAARRYTVTEHGRLTETTLDYSQITAKEGTCPSAANWLTRARGLGVGDGTFWDSAEMKLSSGGARDGPPALHFLHGFQTAGMAAITRANDPFWNMRAFDNALAKHDGYMLTSFICAMNQLVLDDVTTLQAPKPIPAPH